MLRYLILLFFFSSVAYGQPSDFIILKKKDKTIRSYYEGTQIEFVTVTGVYKNALITKIQHDSIFLREYIVRTMITQFGFYITDTAGSYSYVYNYKDIKSIGKKQKGFNVQGSGAALLGGGILLTLASGVSFLVDKDKFSPGLLGAAVGLAVFRDKIPEYLARPGKGDRLSLAYKKGGTHLFLKGVYVLAHCRLGNIQYLRRLGKAQLLGHGQKTFMLRFSHNFITSGLLQIVQKSYR